MDAPPVQYVTTSDGYDIAYGVSGSGPPLVFTGAGLMHLQLAWRMPRLQDWLQCLTARFRVIQIDMRGAGLSSRTLTEEHAVEHYQRDVDAVVERLGLDHFILYGHTFLPTSIATQYAVRNPGRVSALILSGTVRALASQRAPALFSAFPGEDWDIFLRTIVEVGQNPQSTAEAQEMLDLFKQAYDQRDFLLMVNAANRFSLPDLLPRLTTPTLVMVTHGAGLYPLEESQKVARLAREPTSSRSVATRPLATMSRASEQSNPFWQTCLRPPRKPACRLAALYRMASRSARSRCCNSSRPGEATSRSPMNW